MSRCELQVMSPMDFECFETRDRARLVGPSTVPGKFVIEVSGFRVNPSDGTKTPGVSTYEAWPRPGGEPGQFVCGAMAPGEPTARRYPLDPDKPDAEPKCNCKYSDAWRCARDQRLTGQIACWCVCHRRPRDL